jgi:uncharacterized protein (DUF302 family)
MAIIRVMLIIGIFSTLFAGDIVKKRSDFSVDQTIKRIEKILKSKSITVFTIIDHRANALEVGMDLRPSKMIVFGNPALGTKLMQQNMTAGLDLPLRILVYRDKNSRVIMAYRDGSWLSSHHRLDSKLLIEKLNNIMGMIVDKAGKKSNENK